MIEYNAAPSPCAGESHFNHSAESKILFWSSLLRLDYYNTLKTGRGTALKLYSRFRIGIYNLTVLLCRDRLV